MRQFDVFKNPSQLSLKYAPYLIILQSSLTQTRTTVIVAPLVLPKRIPEQSRLFPSMRIGTREFVLSTNELGAVGVKALTERVANLESERSRIIAAIDMLFSGF